MRMREAFYEMGRANAQRLRAQAASMTGTEIIDREGDAPLFDAKKDYSGYPVGSPVRDDGQVWLLIQPHNASHYSGRPGTLRALWGLAHTTNPKKAKRWVEPEGTSGLYMAGECYRAEDGTVYRCLKDGMVYPAEQYADGWERLEE